MIILKHWQNYLIKLYSVQNLQDYFLENYLLVIPTNQSILIKIVSMASHFAFLLYCQRNLPVKSTRKMSSQLNQILLTKSVILPKAMFSSKHLHIFHVSSNTPSYSPPPTGDLLGLQGKLSPYICQIADIHIKQKKRCQMTSKDTCAYMHT